MLYNNSAGKTLEVLQMTSKIVMARKGTNFFWTGKIFYKIEVEKSKKIPYLCNENALDRENTAFPHVVAVALDGHDGVVV